MGKSGQRCRATLPDVSRGLAGMDISRSPVVGYALVLGCGGTGPPFIGVALDRLGRKGSCNPFGKRAKGAG